MFSQIIFVDRSFVLCPRISLNVVKYGLSYLGFFSREIQLHKKNIVCIMSKTKRIFFSAPLAEGLCLSVYKETGKPF